MIHLGVLGVLGVKFQQLENLRKVLVVRAFEPLTISSLRKYVNS
jgi:hypothetical protein